jgi:hypothetical protein
MYDDLPHRLCSRRDGEHSGSFAQYCRRYLLHFISYIIVIGLLQNLYDLVLSDDDDDDDNDAP